MKNKFLFCLVLATLAAFAQSAGLNFVRTPSSGADSTKERKLSIQSINEEGPDGTVAIPNKPLDMIKKNPQKKLETFEKLSILEGKIMALETENEEQKLKMDALKENQNLISKMSVSETENKDEINSLQESSTADIQLETVPSNKISPTTKKLTITCQVTPDKAKSTTLVIMINKDRRSNTIAEIREGHNVRTTSDHYKAEGKIDNDSFNSYLNVTVTSPGCGDSGRYTCLVFSSKDIGEIKEETASTNLRWQETSPVAFKAYKEAYRWKTGLVKQWGMTKYDAFQEGGAFNASSGVFTAPSDGLYAFNLYLQISGSNDIIVWIRHNGKCTGWVWAKDADSKDTASTSTIVDMKKDDKVTVDATRVRYQNKSIFAYFNGYRVTKTK